MLIVAYDAQTSGIASYTLELARVVSQIAETYLICTNGSIELKNVVTLTLAQKRMPAYTPLLNSLLLSSMVSQIICETNPDVVHETLPPLAYRFPNRVTTRWGYVSYPRLAWIRTAQMRFPLNLGGIPVTAQHYLGDKLSQHNARKIVDVSRESENFIPPPMAVGPLKEQPVEDRLQLLFVSRDIFLRRKNLKVVLEALKLVEDRWTLHIAGEGCIDAKNVICHGYMERSEVLKLMNSCDALVLPSLYEELGYVGLEAYSVGLPVIASDIPSFKAIFKKSIFFNPNDGRQLADILRMENRDSLRIRGIESRVFLERSNIDLKHKLLELYASF